MYQTENFLLFPELLGDFTPLYSTGLLDSPPEPVFDRLTVIAARALKVRVSLITLIDKNRQFFKSQCGLSEPLATTRETPLSHSFCKHVVVLEEPLVVEDARTDPFVHNNLAVHELGIIAYLGVPLSDGNGNVIGSVCALDDKPHKWTKDDLDILNALAAQATAEIDQRLRNQEKNLELKELLQLQDDRRQMAQFVIHDLRAPLTSLLLSMEMLPLMGPLNDEQRESLDMSRQNGEVLQKLIDDLLKIEKKGVTSGMLLNRAEYYPQDLILFSVGQVAPLAMEKDIELESDCPATFPPFSVDGDKLIRVLVNLLGNAVKFTPIGGKVRVAVREEEVSGEQGFRFSISDDGVGINSDDAKKVFEEGVSIESTESEVRSAGLGLAFCKRIVEAHGGNITLESQPGKGSTFIILLPSVNTNNA